VTQMSDTKEQLQRARSQFPPPEGVMESLRRRRDRKRRNQRIAAGVVGIAVFVAAVWIVTSGGWFDRTQTPVAPGGTETGPSVAPDPDVEGLRGLPPEGATPSTPESGELVVELQDRVWVYADGRVISRAYLAEPYSGLVEQHLTPEGVEFLRSNVLATGLFEHDLELVREDNPYCCLDIRVRDGDRLVSVRLGPSYAHHPDPPQAQKATPEQEAALQSLEMLLRYPALWPASVWADQQIRAYVPTSYSFCSRWAEPSRVLSRLPEPARDLLGAEYAKMDVESEQPVDCTRMTTEEARALAGILVAELVHEGAPSLGFSFEEPEVPGSFFLIAMNPVLPHGVWAVLAGLG